MIYVYKKDKDYLKLNDVLPLECNEAAKEGYNLLNSTTKQKFKSFRSKFFPSAIKKTNNYKQKFTSVFQNYGLSAGQNKLGQLRKAQYNTPTAYLETNTNTTTFTNNNSLIPINTSFQPYDPYLIKVCKNAIKLCKNDLPNYKEIISDINREFGIETCRNDKRKYIGFYLAWITFSKFFASTTEFYFFIFDIMYSF